MVCRACVCLEEDEEDDRPTSRRHDPINYIQVMALLKFKLSVREPLPEETAESSPRTIAMTARNQQEVEEEEEWGRVRLQDSGV